MTAVAIVPARSGSKGLPGKNIKPLCGKPLLAYTAEVIAEAGIFARALLTTDSEEIAQVGREWGLEAPFLRPGHLAGDETPMVDVIVHALDWLEQNGPEPSVVALLQPTQPLRRATDVKRAVEMLETQPGDSVASVITLPLHMSPDYVMRIDEDGYLKNFLSKGRKIARRQDVRPAYVRDGTVYAFRPETVRNYGDIYGRVCLPLVVKEEYSVNIDGPEDWRLAERRLGCA